MAAFSTNTNILSSSKHHRHLPVPAFPPRCFPSSNVVLFKTHSTFPFLVNCNNNTTTAVAAAPFNVDLASTTSWPEFAENVSGEWDGFGAEFTVQGNPIELPESVVPEAYQEWEVKVFDWQTQCPTLAALSHNNHPSLIYKNIKLLPTVGCEADAATRYSIQERNITAPSHTCPFAYQSTGCYVAVWPIQENKINNTANKSMELEHCLINPRDKESRVRIIQVVELQESELKLRGIRVFVEQWYGPFRNGDQLGGCAIRDSAFAATQPLKTSQVSGVWEGITAVATFHASQSMIQEVGNERVGKSIRDEGDLILLPKQLWCSIKGNCCEVGWLLDEGRTITSKCTFSSNVELKEIAIACETANPV